MKNLLAVLAVLSLFVVAGFDADTDNSTERFAANTDDFMPTETEYALEKGVGGEDGNLLAEAIGGFTSDLDC